MVKVKNIVFDLGGVILTDEDVGFLFGNQYLRSKIKARKERLSEVWHKHWQLVGEGKIDIKTFYNTLQADLTGGFDPEITEKLIEEYKKHTKPLEPFYLLPKLSKTASLYALTNIMAFGLSFKREKFGLDRYFRSIIASSEEGTSKPDPEIFRILINKTGLNPEETVFIDDRERNIDQAKRTGFKTIIYMNLENLKAELVAFGVKI